MYVWVSIIFFRVIALVGYIYNFSGIVSGKKYFIKFFWIIFRIYEIYIVFWVFIEVLVYILREILYCFFLK